MRRSNACKSSSKSAALWWTSTASSFPKARRCCTEARQRNRRPSRSRFQAQRLRSPTDRTRRARTPWFGRGRFPVQPNPNPGEPLKPLRLTASSGEMSRVLLAVKSALAKQDAVGLLVFDEIDANVGGNIAEAVGRKMASLGSTHQVSPSPTSRRSPRWPRAISSSPKRSKATAPSPASTKSLATSASRNSPNARRQSRVRPRARQWCCWQGEMMHAKFRVFGYSRLQRSVGFVNDWLTLNRP